jgi:hypothetical protein
MRLRGRMDWKARLGSLLAYVPGVIRGQERERVSYE